MDESDSYVVRRPSREASPWKGKDLLLVRLDMELTERCNNNCMHCCINLPADDEAAKRRELSTAEVREILEEAASLGCAVVRFTGGEPLLREDFEELYVFARRRGLKVLLFTNARLLTPELAGLLAQIPPLEKVEVTLYGMRQRSYEAVTRCPGSFEAAWRGIHLLIEKGVPFVVKGAFLPPTKLEMDEMEAWARTLPWTEHRPDVSLFFDLRCRRDSEAKNRLIRALRPAPQEGVSFLARERDEYVRERMEFCGRFMRPGGDRLFACGAASGNPCVDAYGCLQPCLMARHPDTVYDLRKGSLNDGLTRFLPKLKEMRASSPSYLSRCARCFLKGLCEQCPAKSWTEHGTLDTPVEYVCDVAHAEAAYLGLLAPGEQAWEVSDWAERVAQFAAGQLGPRDADPEGAAQAAEQA